MLMTESTGSDMRFLEIVADLGTLETEIAVTAKLEPTQDDGSTRQEDMEPLDGDEFPDDGFDWP